MSANFKPLATDETRTARGCDAPVAATRAALVLAGGLLARLRWSFENAPSYSDCRWRIEGMILVTADWMNREPRESRGQKETNLWVGKVIDRGNVEWLLPLHFS